ncbi:MAG: BspA family leucine-rich repeat surface protein [Prevotella sp.]|nr:BspA family leucine-rich repeat surface protein [Prevotella sp.]
MKLLTMKLKLLILWLVLLAGVSGLRAAEPYTFFDTTDSCLYFCYDNLRSSRNLTTYEINPAIYEPGWHVVAGQVKTVYFTIGFASYRPTSCFAWFSDMRNLTNVMYINRLNTVNVTDMGWMFLNCKSLTRLDVNLFNTAKVTSMGGMFQNCSNLTSLDVSHFNTANVTCMTSMFHNCSKLTKLDVSHFNTDKCTVLDYMFDNCSSLTSLNVSNFNTANVKLMNNMFQGCSNLTSLDVSNFTTSSNLIAVDYMFAGCSKLTSLTLNFTKYGNSNALLRGCYSLKSLTLKVTDNIADNAFEGVGTSYSPCKLSYNKTSHPTFTRITPNYVVWQKGYFQNENMRAFATLNSSGELRFQYSDMFWEYQNNPAYTTYEMNTGTNLPGWYAKRNNVKSAVFEESFTNARPTSCYSWFYYMEHLQSITDLRYLQTENVTNMSRMFSHCNALKSIDVSSFRTGLVTDMHGMFESNLNLESLGETIFSTSQVTDMGAMFANCPKLESLGVKLVGTTNVTDMSGMFSGCTNLKSLELYRLNTANVTNMSSMFSNCQSLTSLDVSNFNTTNVTNMSSMFSNCQSLMSLDVSNFNTTNVTNVSNMFDGCTALTALDLSKFDFSKVSTAANSSAMMRNCSALKELTIPATAGKLGANVCTGVGTKAAPCALAYTLGFIPEITETGDGWYVWKSGYFKDKMQFPQGDVNHDGYVTVVDASLTVDYVMGNIPPVFFIENADMNHDGSVSITDVSKIVDMVMNGNF